MFDTLSRREVSGAREWAGDPGDSVPVGVGAPVWGKWASASPVALPFRRRLCRGGERGGPRGVTGQSGPGPS